MTDRFDALIIGGGMTADAAAKGFREVDGEGSIAILSEDVDPPYARPALSKKLWTDPDFAWSDAELDTAGETGAEVRLATRVIAIDTDAHEITTVDGERIGYGRLLLATGGHPSAPGFEESERVLLYRSAADYRRLRAIANGRGHVVVVGGGYIGQEIAAALVQEGVRVTLVLPDAVVGGAVFPAALARTVDAMFRDAGVELVTEARATGGREADGVVTVDLEDGTSLQADAVVVGLGIEPATGLAEEAGIDVGDGVLVDERLRTSAADVLAAGDVANYPDRILGRRRIEHVDNAQAQGRTAGRNLAGADEVYEHTPFYYSALFGNRYEAVGTLDASLRTVERWLDGGREGVVYYLDGDGHPVGVLNWNLEDRLDEARSVLASDPPLSAEQLA
ncbi:NAD(P)/FAD-dependent oxidoreductase [Arenivirga flava]|uniref:Pyridine nucleotide-disulfide oxidoreductase n=1 Tax=Arenivirga flava TaxID=1930060 RepID=A0AA37UG38_9MICO|nr:NAD(P)/FAD-dependent oxidoreductase [Arenivirga flava]GMA28249.1 pyridine nucleotide-disulfide oxidoreductase [Arenivirga flava]